jgi:hypothetical protein
VFEVLRKAHHAGSASRTWRESRCQAPEGRGFSKSVRPAACLGLGLSEATADAIRSMDEHWDGGGNRRAFAAQTSRCSDASSACFG